MKFKAALAGLILLFVLSGCSGSVIRIGKQQEVQEIAFTNGKGHAIITVDEHGVDHIVIVRGLKAGEPYTIALYSDKGESPGFLFGPAANVDLRVGEIQNDTQFIPNSEGELFVSMKGPIRMFEGTKEHQLEIRDSRDKIVMKTRPFVLESRK